MRSPEPNVCQQPDPRLERAVRVTVLTGLLLVLALPIARGHSVWLGVLPLWLLGMPLVSWWALHRFALPRPPRSRHVVARARRHDGPQARRRPGRRAGTRLGQAA